MIFCNHHYVQQPVLFKSIVPIYKQKRLFLYPYSYFDWDYFFLLHDHSGTHCSKGRNEYRYF